MIEIRLFGAFGVNDANGADLRPKLMKSRAILAILAATPGHRHSRSWFQQLLWQDRQQAQAMSSLRSSLSDIRRRLGPHGGLLLADHSDIALDPNLFTSDLDLDRWAPKRPSGEFLEGFDITHADEFEDWLREMRMSIENATVTTFAAPRSEEVHQKPDVVRLLLAPRGNQPNSLTRIQCDALIDGISKSAEDLSMVEVVDDRCNPSVHSSFQEAAQEHGCSQVLISDVAEGPNETIARIRVLDADNLRPIWSKTLNGKPGINLDDPMTMGIVTEFIEVMASRVLRSIDAYDELASPQFLAAAGINHIFKLGTQNFDTADLLLKRAHEMDPQGRYLAWRAYLRTFLLGEFEYENRSALVEEGTVLARRALEMEPHNSMVLALCAHVENMLHDCYEKAFELSARALELNRYNPLAWSSLGNAAAFLGKAEDGLKVSQVGARLALSSPYSFQLESWASAAGIIAGDIDAARQHAERSHLKSPSFAPAMRFLSALYCHDGAFERAAEVAGKLRLREPDFTLERLKEEGYPADSLRKAGLTDHLPIREM